MGETVAMTSLPAPRRPSRRGRLARRRAALGGLRTCAASVLACVVVVPLVGTGAAAATPAAAGGAIGTVALPSASSPLPPGARIVGPSAGSTEVTVEVSLEPRDPAALEAFTRSVTTSGSPEAGHFLAPGRFGPTFGASPAAVDATRAWLDSAGLRPGPVAPDRLFMSATGTVAQLDAAFAAPLVDVRLPDGRVVRQAAGAPRVPASLAGVVAGVIGLSTEAPSRPHLVAGTGAVRATPSVGAPGPRLGPTPCAAAQSLGQGTWTADQLASAYGLSTLYGQGRIGAGQSVALYELEGFNPTDIQGYESCYGVNASVSTVAVDGGPTGPQHGEAALDIEVVAGLAPFSSIVVYAGPNDGGAGPLDTYSKMINDDSARVISTSWGGCEGPGGIPPSEQQAETVLFQQAAAQGQTVFAASGDSGSSDCYNPNAGNLSTALWVDDPADQPNVTGVGGTSLTNIATTPPAETVWNNGPAGGAGGGGISVDFAAPSWQQIPDAQNSFTRFNCGPSANQQCREVPDVSASSDPAHGDAILWDGYWYPIGGTSAAAPLWAALTADDAQGCGTAVGALNPKLYPAGAGGSPPFNDITAPGNNDLFYSGIGPKHYPATPHYDLASGWGTPQATSLLSTLTGSSAGCPAVTGLSSAQGPATGGQTVTIGGNGFGSGMPAVHFGGAAAAVVAHSPTSVTVVTPDVTYGGQATVTVSTSGTAAGTSAGVPMAQYTFISPQVTAVVPRRGPTQGGTTVTVSGSDFLGATSVRFGGSPASFSVVSAGTIVATAPSGPAAGATVDVSVTGPDGTSPPSAADRFTFALPGYWLTGSDGGIFNFGHAGYFGSTGAMPLNEPVVGMAATPDDGGYWLVASDGGIFSFGDAGYYGSTGAMVLNRPIVGMASTPDGNGYWLVASDGGIFSFGDAGFHGSTGAITLNRPVVGMAATTDGNGYWLVASDGGIFSFGDAGFHGSTGAIALNRPVVGMAATAGALGYWLVASDGGIFSFGDAGFHGSTGAIALNRPVVGMATSLTGNGYWLVASDGGIFSFGDAGFSGSTGAIALNRPIVAMAST